MTVIQSNAFYGAINLEELNLNYNHIKIVENNAFSPLKNLYLLKLDNNPISKTFRQPKELLFRNGAKLFKKSLSNY